MSINPLKVVKQAVSTAAATAGKAVESLPRLKFSAQELQQRDSICARHGHRMRGEWCSRCKRRYVTEVVVLVAHDHQMLVDELMELASKGGKPYLKKLHAQNAKLCKHNNPLTDACDSCQEEFYGQE